MIVLGAVSFIGLAIVDVVILSNLNKQKVLRDQVVALATCAAANNCRVPRKMTTIAGENLWSIGIITPDGDEIRYFFGTDKVFRVMMTPMDTKLPILIEDTGYTGVVKRVIETNREGKIIETTAPNEKGFGERLTKAQHLYSLAMGIAQKAVIPQNKSSTQNMLM